MLDQLSVGGNILQATDEHELKEYDWINRRVACLAIELFRGLIDDAQVKCLLQPTVESVLRDAAGQLKTSDLLFGIFFSALHTLRYRKGHLNP